jgi:hypothetical protein
MKNLNTFMFIWGFAPNPTDFFVMIQKTQEKNLVKNKLLPLSGKSSQAKQVRKILNTAFSG